MGSKLTKVCAAKFTMLQGKAFSEWWWGSKFVAAAPKRSFKQLSTKERNKLHGVTYSTCEIK